MLFLAATALEKAANVPKMFWVNVVLAIAGFILAVFLLRKLMEVNKVLLIIVGGATAAIFGFQWIYERNEPAFLTSSIDVIAPFFPGKGAYENKQKDEPGNPGLKKHQTDKPTKAKAATTPKKY